MGADGLVCGGSEPITAVIEHLDANTSADPSFGVLADHMRRIASVQIRSVGSWAGNLMIAREHRDFPSDMVTILSAAQVLLAWGCFWFGGCFSDIFRRDGGSFLVFFFRGGGYFCGISFRRPAHAAW